MAASRSFVMEPKENDVLGMLLEAVDFAAKKHRDQRRKDEHQTPYINHPIGVAYLLWKEGGVTDIAVLQVLPYLTLYNLAKPEGCQCREFSVAPIVVK